MKLTINKSILEQTLGQANRVIEKRIASPVLGYVLFETINNDLLRVTATNLDMTVVTDLPCSVISPGSACLPATLLFDITKKLDTDITFELDGNNIKIISGKSNFTINYINGSDFPPITKIDYYLTADINVQDFRTAINTVRVAMSQDSTRIQLNGIYIHSEENAIKFVTTDLFRIAAVTLNQNIDIEPLIISRRMVAELIHLLDTLTRDKDESKIITLKASENQIAIESTLSNNIKSVLSSRLISGKFPEYRPALKVQNDKELIVNTRDFISALERVSTVVTDNSNSIKLTLEPNKLIISAISKEFGSAKDELEVDFNYSLEICFNSKYLIELIRQIKTEQVKILLDTSTAPTLITPANDEDNNLDTVFVIMPVEIVIN